LLGEFKWCWGCCLKVLVRCFSFFILLNALPVPMLRQVFIQWFFLFLFSVRFWKGILPFFGFL
jgi:hypothetical protein